MTLFTLVLEIIQSILILVLGGLLLYVYNRCKTLARSEQAVQEQLDKYRREQFGLCSAAVQVDKRLMEQEKRVRELVEKMELVISQESSSSPYYSAVDQIRKGASPQEVVTDFGLSMPEAKLLHNLYSLKQGNRIAPTS
ncbi:MAG: DUF2802 domain-containing protein [Methylococcaceae bacterium]